MSDDPLISVQYSSVFKRNIRALAKKYRSIRSDIQPVIQQLEQGELLGDQISGIGYTVFKIRVKNSDNQKVDILPSLKAWGFLRLKQR